MVISDDSGYVIYGFLSAFLHEFGHVLAMISFKKRIKKIDCGFANIDLLMEQKNLNCSSFETTVIFLSGSLFNFLISILFKILYMIFRLEVFNIIFYQNLFLGTINLLPIYSLDGEQLIRIFLENKLQDKNIDKIILILSFVFTVPILVIGFLLLFHSKYNISLFLVCIYLLSFFILKKDIF